MANSEVPNMSKDMKAKLAMLDYTTSKTQSLIEGNEQESLLRQLKAVKSVMDSCEQLRVSMTENLFAQEKPEEDIEQFNEHVQEKLAKCDASIQAINDWFSKKKESKEQDERDGREREFLEREKVKDELQKQRLEEKIRLELEAVHKRNELELKYAKEKQEPASSSKLPRIQIAEFAGSKLDWLRFWGLFTKNVDCRNIPACDKLSYLLGYLSPKVRECITGLEYTENGYKAAKEILERKYGDAASVTNAYVSEILDLPCVTGANPHKIAEFYATLSRSVKALATMSKLATVEGLVAKTLDKLPGIKGDLVRNDPDWKKWGFQEFERELELWTLRNEVDHSKENPPCLPRKPGGPKHSFTTGNRPGCVYCGQAHKPAECDVIADAKERKKYLLDNQRCFNCTSKSHQWSTCTSKGTCVRCHERHHTSLHDLYEKPKTKAMTAVSVNETIFPVVVINVNGIMCRALVDSGSSCSYVSAYVASLFRTRPSRTLSTTIEMLVNERHVQLDVYDAKVESLNSDFNMQIDLLKVNRSVLLHTENPRYDDLINKYPHLKSVTMDDVDTKAQLPIHVVLGGGEFAKIKTSTCPCVGQVGDPVAEFTKLGWVIMSPGQQFDRTKMLLTQSTHLDYEELCRLDVLGLADHAEQTNVHEEFREQLTRSPEGWYETGLPWRGAHPPLPDNRAGAECRLNQLNRKLQKQRIVEQYGDIIKDQLANGIVELAPPVTTGKVCYIPHRPVVREGAETTKIRIVYDASARADSTSPSLNQCLYPGPPLQNRLWDVLVRNRARPIALCGDVKQAFLQIRIRESERDALRFLWDGQTFRFTRALFGLTSSPFLLNGVLKEHLAIWEPREPEVVHELQKSTYVDDLISGSNDLEGAHKQKTTAKTIFSDAGFTLHKWNSNVAELEDQQPNTGEQTFAKSQLKVPQYETRLLGLKWDKVEDTLAVSFPATEPKLTKRGILSHLAQIYDPLGLSAPRTLGGKLIYREACKTKAAWDTELPPELKLRWRKWASSLPLLDVAPRAYVQFPEPIDCLELHAFGDASKDGVAAAVYAVVRQPSGVTSNLVAARSRLAKETSIPRLELIAAHMATNLLANVSATLTRVASPDQYLWSDSTVVLWWLRHKGEYRQFVANRIAKILEYPSATWLHVPSAENPADLASRSGEPGKLWWKGPPWLTDHSRWPANPVVEESPASAAEVKPQRTVLCVGALPVGDCFDRLLERFPLRKSLRCVAYLRRLAVYCRSREIRRGPLTTEEIQSAETWWVRRVQSHIPESEFEQRSDLGLTKNAQNLIECHGRIVGKYPLYLPDHELFTEKLVERAHLQTLHGGVTATMASIRERYWIPRLRKLTKQVRAACYGCKRYHAQPFSPANTSALPVSRTEGDVPYQVIGVDFAGPIRYRDSNQEGKAYLALFACSLTRGVHLELLKSLETTEFLKVLKRFIARRGRPSIIYSDNGSTFKAAADWLHKVHNEERFHDALTGLQIKWRFNLAKAPWWGGQFERLIGVFKATFYKGVGNACLTFAELEDVVLDVEVCMNSRPLCYMEDDVSFPTLTPSAFLFQAPNAIPELPAHLHDANLRKRAKFLLKVKENLWTRWVREYLNALRERHQLNLKPEGNFPAEGDLLLIKGDSPNRGKWLVGKVTRLISGRDGVIRGAKLKTAHGDIERPLRFLYPLELRCDVSQPTAPPEPLDQQPRPIRAAAKVAAQRIAETAVAELQAD